jgi:hypothetical protein
MKCAVGGQIKLGHLKFNLHSAAKLTGHEYKIKLRHTLVTPLTTIFFQHLIFS